MCHHPSGSGFHRHFAAPSGGGFHHRDYGFGGYYPYGYHYDYDYAYGDP
jgi:hypothetical protein